MIALLGGNGYVGRAFQAYFHARDYFCLSVGRSQLNYQDVVALRNFLLQAKPRFLINCAGYTGKPNVDACEWHKAECLAGNAVLPGVVRAACEEAGVPWGHVSSGCIYTGAKARTPDGQWQGFNETDAPNFSFRQNNCSFYSGTKALGEEILEGAEKCYVWRLRIPFNEVDGARNYLSKVMRYDTLLEATNSLSQLDEFVRACWECFANDLPHGIYNVTNPGYVTTREVVELIRKSGVCTKEFKFFADEEEFMQKAAQTPRSNCVLDSGKLGRAGVKLTEVHEAVQAALHKWKKEK